MRFNLQFKLFFSVFFVLILAWFILMGQTISRERKIIQTSFQKKATVLAQALEAGIASREELKDQTKLQSDIYKLMWLDPEIIGIAISIPTDEGFKIVASNNSAEIGKIAESENSISYEKNIILTKTLSLADGTPILRTFTPIHVGGQRVGSYDIKLSLEAEEKTIRRQQKEFILMISIIIVFLIIYFFVVLKKIIINPIIEIERGLEKIGVGELNYRIIPKSQDEIGDLAIGVNKMAEKLEELYRNLEEKVKERTAELEEIKTSLEIRVEARTRELRELAEGLEEKVKERTKELQEKVEELERFNKLAVGRELKMIELKKRIKELEEYVNKTRKKKNNENKKRKKANDPQSEL